MTKHLQIKIPMMQLESSANKTNDESVATDKEEDTESNIDNINRSESKVTEERVLARIIRRKYGVK